MMRRPGDIGKTPYASPYFHIGRLWENMNRVGIWGESFQATEVFWQSLTLEQIGIGIGSEIARGEGKKPTPVRPRYRIKIRA